MMRKIERERGYREYDSQISVRICNKFYRLCCLFNRYNVCNFIRKLIRADLANDYFLTIDLKDFFKLNKVFNIKDFEDIKKYQFSEKRDKKLTIKMYAEEKKELQRRGEGNISRYIHYMFIGFVENIVDDYRKEEEKLNGTKI